MDSPSISLAPPILGSPQNRMNTYFPITGGIATKLPHVTLRTGASNSPPVHPTYQSQPYYNIHRNADTFKMTSKKNICKPTTPGFTSSRSLTRKHFAPSLPR